MNKFLESIVLASMLTLINCERPKPIPVTFTGKPLAVEGSYGSVQKMAIVLEKDCKTQELILGTDNHYEIIPLAIARIRAEINSGRPIEIIINGHYYTEYRRLELDNYEILSAKVTEACN
jgi:hypothetical protein